MALIKCPECGLSISDKAAACPNCGYPLQPAPEPVEYELTRSNPSESKIGKFLRACVWVDGIVLIIWTIVIIFTAASTTYTRCVHHRNCAAKPAKLSMDSAEIEQRFRVN